MKFIHVIVISMIITFLVTVAGMYVLHHLLHMGHSYESQQVVNQPDDAPRDTVIMGDPLQGTEWDYQGGNIIFDEGRYTADLGCNVMMGTYHIDNKQATFQLGATTLMACEGVVQEREDQFISQIEQITRWQKQGEDVLLHGPDVEMRLTPVGHKGEDQALTAVGESTVPEFELTNHIPRAVGETVTNVVQVGPTRIACTGVVPMECLVVNGELFYDDIEGFVHQEGDTVVLRIEVTQYCDGEVLGDCPMDRGMYEYRLVKELSRIQQN